MPLANLTTDRFQMHLDSALAAFKAKQFAVALQHALCAKLMYEQTQSVPSSSTLGLARRELHQRLSQFIDICSQVRDSLGSGGRGGSPIGLDALKAPPIGSHIEAPRAPLSRLHKSHVGRASSQSISDELRRSSKGGSPEKVSKRQRAPTKDTAIEVRLEEAIRIKSRLPQPEKQKRFFQDGKLLTVADFAYSDKKIAIFCDGWRYHGEKGVVSSDAKKRNQLTAHGWRVLTFWGKEIYRDPEGCEAQIWDTYCREPGQYKG